MNDSIKLSLDSQGLRDYIDALLNTYLPDERPCKVSTSTWSKALERLQVCFEAIHIKYFHQNQSPYFNHLHSDHMAMLLYIISNQAYQDDDLPLAEKTFYLNKIMHSIDAFYAIELPEIFLFVHPLGTVLGSAHYENYFTAYQNVTVGSDIDGVYPIFGEGTVLYAGVTVIGRVTTGGNNIFGAQSFLKNCHVPANKMVLNSYPNHIFSDSKLSVIEDIYGRKNAHKP